MTLLRLVILDSTIIHQVVSGDGFQMLSVLAFVAEGHKSADTGWRINVFMPYSHFDDVVRL